MNCKLYFLEAEREPLPEDCTACTTTAIPQCLICCHEFLHWIISAMTLIGRVTARCLNLHTVTFQSSLLTEELDGVIVTLSRFVSHSLEAVVDLEKEWPRFRIPPPPLRTTPLPQHPAARSPPALRLAVDLDLVLTVGTVDLGLVFDPVPWVEDATKFFLTEIILNCNLLLLLLSGCYKLPQINQLEM